MIEKKSLTNLIGAVTAQQSDRAPIDGQDVKRLRGSNRLEVKLTSETKSAIAEERNGDDGTGENVDRIHVRNDTSTW